MEAKFGRRITVLFVLEIDRNQVKEFARRMGHFFSDVDSYGFDGSWDREDGSDAVGVPTALYGGDRFPLDPFFFTDYQTLRSIHGNTMMAKIYFWHDGNEWSLANDD